jgi:hypothetical protein
LLGDEDDRERDDEAETGGDLKEAGVEAALAVGHVFGKINGGAAVFASDGQALKEADGDEGDGGDPSCGFEGWQKADGSGGCAHDGEGGYERDSAAEEIADAAEEESAEGADEKSHGEGGEVCDEGECVVVGRVELDGENGCERAEDVEVVPLDQGPGGGTQYNAHEGVPVAGSRAGEIQG